MNPGGGRKTQKENTMTSTIDALKRLERAGDSQSRATEKLHKAAFAIALVIEKKVPDGVDLPRGYRVIREHSNVGSDLFLVLERGTDDYGEPMSYWIDGTGGYLHGDFHAKIPAQTREGSLQFAEDIATGLLDDIAEFLEQRAAKEAEATQSLEGAK